MNVKQFCGLQVFEIGYLLVLCFLPWVVAQPAVSTLLISVSLLYGCYYIYKKATLKKIDVKGKGVVVTGCDTGFGFSLAKRLDYLGFTVYAGCLSSDCEGAETLRSSTTGKMNVVQLDVTSDDSVNKALKFVTDHVNKNNLELWAVVNNAGLNFLGDVEFCPMDIYKRIADVNLYGVVRVTKAFLPLIRKAKGRIVNCTSVKGRLSLPTNTAYNITKYGVETFSDGLRLEMLKFGVKVIVVEPGNFGGATGMLNEKSLKVMRKDFDTMWTEAGADVKETYGKDYLEGLYTAGVNSKDTTHKTLAPVIDAYEDAIVNMSPQYRYLVDGSNQLFDIYCMLARLNAILPVSCMDYLVDKVFSSGLPVIAAHKNK